MRSINVDATLDNPKSLPCKCKESLYVDIDHRRIIISGFLYDF